MQAVIAGDQVIVIMSLGEAADLVHEPVEWGPADNPASDRLFQELKSLPLP